MGTCLSDNIDSSFAIRSADAAVVSREPGIHATRMNTIPSDGISHRLDGISQWDSMGYPNGIRWDIPMGLKRVSPLNDGITGISMFFAQSVDRKTWIRSTLAGCSVGAERWTACFLRDALDGPFYNCHPYCAASMSATSAIPIAECGICWSVGSSNRIADRLERKPRSKRESLRSLER